MANVHATHIIDHVQTCNLLQQYVLCLLFSGWTGWYCTILNAKDEDENKLSALMLEILVENLNYDGKVGSYTCVYSYFTNL